MNSGPFWLTSTPVVKIVQIATKTHSLMMRLCAMP
jgi:hypothetical protein